MIDMYYSTKRVARVKGLVIVKFQLNGSDYGEGWVIKRSSGKEVDMCLWGDCNHQGKECTCGLRWLKVDGIPDMR